MNKLVLKINETTMDSREIAELTEKQHRNVVRDIRRQLDEQKISLLTFEQSYVNGRGQEYPCFKLDYEQTMILLSGYSIPLRATVIKRWQELEKEEAPPLPSTYGEALLEAGRLAVANEQLQLENEQMRPAVQFYEDVTGSDDAIPMGETAKVINCGMGRNQLFEYLRKKKVLQQSNVPYQRFVDNGWFRVIESKYTDKLTGDTKINIKTLVYQKGLDNIMRNLRKDNLMREE